MAGISDKALKTQYAENKFRYNDGTELANKEFSDGSGLEMYETDFRGYDPQLGRFWQLDPLTEVAESISPYAFASDNPILLNDPLGLADDSASSASSLPAGPPHVCNACSLPKGDPAKAFGPPPSSVPAPINPDKGYKWYEFFNDHNPGGDFLYQVNRFNPLANAVNAIDTYISGHDTYGVHQTNTEATIQLATVLPIGRVAPVMGMVERELMTEGGALLNEEIKITEEGFAHIIERHYPRSGMWLDKSKFTISAREIVGLIKNSAQVPKLLQRGGNFQRVVNAGRIIGIDVTTGKATSYFTIITNKVGEVVTAFPGLPGR